MGYGDEALYGKELRDALGSFPGVRGERRRRGARRRSGKSNLANFQIRGVAQLDASADVYLDGNATDDAATPRTTILGPASRAHVRRPPGGHLPVE